jgi:hypothetical protein
MGEIILKAAVRSRKDGMLIAAKNERDLGKFYHLAARSLANQALSLSKHTGLSVDLCSSIVLHRAKRRMD